MRDADKYPSPVRGRGSGHSTTLCGVADGGTVVDVTPDGPDPRDRRGHGHHRGRRAPDRRLEGASEAQSPDVRQHRAGERDDGQPRHVRDEGRVDAGRVRPGELVLRRHEAGPAVRRDPRGRREGPRPPASRALELRALRDRLRGDVQGAPAPGDGGRAQGLQGRGLRAQAARALRARAVDHDVHLPVPRQRRSRVSPVHRPRRPGDRAGHAQALEAAQLRVEDVHAGLRRFDRALGAEPRRALPA